MIKLMVQRKKQNITVYKTKTDTSKPCAIVPSNGQWASEMTSQDYNKANLKKEYNRTKQKHSNSTRQFYIILCSSYKTHCDYINTVGSYNIIMGHENDCSTKTKGYSKYIDVLCRR